MGKHAKTRQYERVVEFMMTGQPVQPEEIVQHFKNTDLESTMYRLPAYLSDIRQNGGIIRVRKNGKKIDTYQLINIECFDRKGRWIEASATG
jgi:hypothetical protein